MRCTGPPEYSNELAARNGHLWSAPAGTEAPGRRALTMSAILWPDPSFVSFVVSPSLLGASVFSGRSRTQPEKSRRLTLMM
eukprot:7138613-Pyramimonas_sp.AAC.1